MSALTNNPEINESMHIRHAEVNVDDVIGDRFVINGSLGAGQDSKVYDATDRLSRVDVALKVPRIDNDGAMGRFIREVEVTQSLSTLSEDTVQFVDAGLAHDSTRPFLYLATEKLKGGSLADKIRYAAQEGGGLAVSQVVTAMAPAVAGLSKAHDSQIVNRDVKPGNIFLDRTGRGKMGDWGIAALESDDPEDFKFYQISPSVVSADHTDPTKVLGTFNYLAPEAFEGRHRDKPEAADVYGVGATLHHALIGEKHIVVPEEYYSQTGDTNVSNPIIKRALENYRPPQEALYMDRAIPKELTHLVLSCLEKEPSMRPSAYQVAERLREVGQSTEDANTAHTVMV